MPTAGQERRAERSREGEGGWEVEQWPGLGTKTGKSQVTEAAPVVRGSGLLARSWEAWHLSGLSNRQLRITKLRTEVNLLENGRGSG